MDEIPETMLKRAFQPLAENDQDGEKCNECGQSVRIGTGRFVNRVIDLNSYQTRKEMGKPYPDGNYQCAECDTALDVQTENVLQMEEKR